MKLIKAKKREHLTAITVRIFGSHAERYRRAREIAARHDAAVDLRTGVERLIDAMYAEALTLAGASSGANVPADAQRGADGDARSDASGAAPDDARADAQGHRWPTILRLQHATEES